MHRLSLLPFLFLQVLPCAAQPDTGVLQTPQESSREEVGDGDVVANPLMRAIVRELRAVNPHLNQFSLMSLAIVDPWDGRGYVAVGYGLRKGVARRGPQDELFGVFAVNDSLTRVWRTFEIIPSPRWGDWMLRIVRAAGDSVVVVGHSVDYGKELLYTRRAYAWPRDRYSEP